MDFDRDHFMRCMARDALRRYTTKGARQEFYKRLFKNKKPSLGEEKAREFVVELKNFMKEEWEKGRAQYERKSPSASHG